MPLVAVQALALPTDFRGDGLVTVLTLGPSQHSLLRGSEFVTTTTRHSLLLALLPAWEQCLSKCVCVIFILYPVTCGPKSHGSGPVAAWAATVGFLCEHFLSPPGAAGADPLTQLPEPKNRETSERKSNR